MAEDQHNAMMPNFRNVYKQETDFQRGYMTSLWCRPWKSNARKMTERNWRQTYKDAITEAGDWNVFMMMQGETIPKETNHVCLSKDKKDDWGIPQLDYFMLVMMITMKNY